MKDNQKFNESINPNSAFMAELRQKLPEFFTAAKYDENGELVESSKFDNDKFQQALQKQNVNELSSGYRLDFIGKNIAKKKAGEKSETVIVPDKDHNEKPDNKNSNNLFFTGDNLEVLRHLQQNYTNSVDFIYIDPPYNTGSDGFIYNDKFEYDNDQLKDMFGLNDDELVRMKSIQGKSTHSAWLAFMYPRLYLAKQLLTNSGSIFISIDENEQANLKLLMDDIFGESSYIGEIIRKTRSSTNDASNGFNQQHEFALIYGRDSNLVQLHGEQKDNSNYRNPDNDPLGPWISDNPSARSGGSNAIFEIINPINGHIDTPPSGRYWAFSHTTFDQWVKNGKVIFRDRDKENRRGFIVKKYLSELKSNFNTVNSLFGINNKFMNQSATKYLRDELFNKNNFFTSPKPLEYIKKLIKYGCKDNSLILDFFAGSATTADAAMQLNAEDGGHRKYIMVQLPEKTDTNSAAYKAGYKTIDQISRARIEKAAANIQTKNPLLAETQDLGFKHYRFVKPNQQILDKISYTNDIQLNMFDDMISQFSSDKLGVQGNATGFDTILQTYLVEDNYKFDVPVKMIDFAGIKLPYVNGQRIYIIANDWTADNTKALVNAIGTNKMTIQTVVVYGYTITMEHLRELEIALNQLENKVNLLVRY